MMRLTRFHIVFFATFAALGVLMAVLGDVERPRHEQPAPAEIAPVRLAERLLEGRRDFVVADWMDASFVPDSMRVDAREDAAARVIDATGGDLRRTVVLLADHDGQTRATATALQTQGYRVVIVAGGTEAWRRDVLEADDADPTTAALSRWLQGKTAVPAAAATAGPVAVPVAPRRRTTGGSGGC